MICFYSSCLESIGNTIMGRMEMKSRTVVLGKEVGWFVNVSSLTIVNQCPQLLEIFKV